MSPVKEETKANPSAVRCKDGITQGQDILSPDSIRPDPHGHGEERIDQIEENV